MAGSVESSESRWDEFLWDVGLWASGVIERKLTVGLSAIGRWMRIRIDHQVAGEKFGFASITAEHVPAGDAAGAA